MDGNGNGDQKSDEERKDELREERERDPEEFDRKYGTGDDYKDESGDPHKQ